MRTGTLVFLLLVSAAAPKLRADATLFLGEPYGGYGSLVPMGHAAVYLNRVCAVSPVHLRRCGPGEVGVVISRYRKITRHDWIAIPLLPYLYAVEHSTEVPASADAATVRFLRDEYRHRHLQDLIPDGPQGSVPRGDWIQLLGAAYDRRIFAFQMETTPEQDDAFIREFNARENQSHFNLVIRNCADFARQVMNFYFPKAVRRSVIADLGVTTPKQVARSLVRYNKKHPELQCLAFVIPQIPGSRSRSKGARGVLESLVMSKKYVVPLTIVNLWLTPALAVGYVTSGRFNPASHAVTVRDPVAMEQSAILANERRGAPCASYGATQAFCDEIPAGSRDNPFVEDVSVSPAQQSTRNLH